MKKIFYEIIGKRGRITIPLLFRMLLGITNDTLLKWECDGIKVIITPMVDLGNLISEKRAKMGLTQEQANQLVSNLTPEAIKCLLSAAKNKLN